MNPSAKYRILALSCSLALGGLAVQAQTNTISSVSIGTASTAGGTANGVAVITPRIGTPLNQAGSVGNNLAGLQYVAGQVPLTGSPASIAFFALAGSAIPGGAGNPATDFTSYGTLISPTAVTTYADVASKLTPNSYSALTFAAADLGFGAGDFYSIHHTNAADYLAEIVPGTATSSSIADLKPMSWTGPTAGGPASPGAKGYFGLTWATGILSAGAPYADQSIYYLRTDSGSHIRFGVIIPALTGSASDTLDLTSAVGSFGVAGYTTLAFSPSVIGNYPASQFYYLRQDSITGNTILGRLNPSLLAGARTISDIANLGGVFNSLAFAADATGPAGAWGSSQFYASGALAAGAQSISFEAIPDHHVGDVFKVTPTASSNLDIVVTVVSGPATVQTTGVAGATPSSLRVFTITTTGPGIVTLQARQAGQTLPTLYTANLLQQSFNVLGIAGVPAITSATSAPGTVNAPFTYSIVATGSPTSYASGTLPAGLLLNTSTGVISGTPSAAATTVVSLTATNSIGTSSPVTLTIIVAPAGTAPVITSSTGAAGTVSTAFSYSITATGSPTSYASGTLPSGLALNTATGVISGTPSVSGTSVAQISATNGSGTGSATLTITVAAATVAPVITSPSTAPGTVGTPFVTYPIVATGLPTSYTATGLPPGLSLDPVTGAINGTPTTAGTYVVTITAGNSAGISTATLTITIAGAGVAPVIISPPSATGTAGAPFITYPIVATGLPTSYTATGLPPGLTLDPLTGAINGTPTTPGVYPVTITATNSTGTSSTTLTITVAAPFSRIVNFSTRAQAGSGNQTLILGFVVAGNNKTLLVRGNGPDLIPFGVVNTLPDPALTLYGAGGQIATNTGWQTSSNPGALSAAAAQLGAFAQPNGSADSALIVGVNSGAYTAQLVGASGDSGTALIEAYDDDSNLNARLVNASARMQINLAGGNLNPLTIGFVIAGNTPKTVLIRGIGPGLSAFGVTGVLANPQITIFSSSAQLATNSNWTVGNSVPQITATSAQVGAFPLVSGSLDAALTVTLQPGTYTVQIIGVGNTSGVALLEVYDVQ